MKIRIAVGAGSLGVVLLAALPALACYSCQNSCCEEATQGTTGRDTCVHDTLCFAGRCTCHDCDTSGSSCDGSAPSGCDNPYGCEEHQTLHVVPHGTVIDWKLATGQAASAQTDGVGRRAVASCSVV